jgi:hypothetical protein
MALIDFYSHDKRAAIRVNGSGFHTHLDSNDELSLIVRATYCASIIAQAYMNMDTIESRRAHKKK